MPSSFTDPQMTESVAPEQQTTTPSTDHHKPRNRRAPQGNNKGAQPSRARKVHPVLEKLFTLYPNIFGAHFLPL